MKILYVSSGKMFMANLVIELIKMGHEVEAFNFPGERIENEEEIHREFEHSLSQSVDLVIANFFFPQVAEDSHRLHVKYAVYSLDSPNWMTYGEGGLRYDNVYLFYFDDKEYQMQKRKGYQNVYYLPLAAGITWADALSITDEEIQKYKCDLSFIGTLYSDNLYDDIISVFPAPLQEELTRIFENSAFIWDGKDRLGESLTPELMKKIRQIVPQLCSEEGNNMPEDYFFRQSTLARKLTNIERTLLLELIAERYDFRLYTWEKEKVPETIKRYPGVDYETEALKIFYASRINLNITMRSIESGIPQRIYDIMSVGGFVMTNWSEEIPRFFEEGKEIVTFQTPEEMLEKIAYYLDHETERLRIGYNGYKKVKECYSYEKQLNKLLGVVCPDIMPGR